MASALEDTTARLAELVRRDLYGAELQEFTLVSADATERAYIVRWSRAEPREEHGTHRALLAEDGRGALVWGHYATSEADAVADYKERRKRS